MSSILDIIVAGTRKRVTHQRLERPLSELESEEGFQREPIDWAERLRAPGLSIIAEVKKASPTAGVIRTDFDPVALAAGYAAGGATAVSILTEEDHFQGSPAFIAEARREIDIPILRKDFIVDPWQIAEARALGADAVLLIATILDRSHADELLAACATYGLGALVECYDIREVDRIDMDRVDVVGVNSRDLHTFEVDLERAVEALVSLPSSVVRVAESGIRTAADGARLVQAGIDAALIGESFMRAPNPGDALARFLESVAQTS